MKTDDRKIKNLKIKLNILKHRSLAYILVPTLALSGGYITGRILSNNIDEYKTITKTYNAESGSIIDIDEEYDENNTLDVITVLQYEPWQNQENQYYRKVNAYEYNLKAVKEKDYCLNESDIDNFKRLKYSYIEKKEEINDEDLKENSIIIIQETTQDKNNKIKSNKYIIPACIVGTGLGLLIDLIVYLSMFLDSYDIEEYIRKLVNKIEFLEDKKLYK